MALEEFTGDLRNGPVELPCHTQRLATQRNAISSRKISFSTAGNDVSINFEISNRSRSARKVIGVTIPLETTGEYPRRTRKSSTRLRNQSQRAWRTRREESRERREERREIVDARYGTWLAFLSPAVRSSPASKLES